MVASPNLARASDLALLTIVRNAAARALDPWAKRLVLGVGAAIVAGRPILPEQRAALESIAARLIGGSA